MQKRILLILFITLHIQTKAEEVYFFRVYMKDKGVTENEINPEQHLSSRTIEKRKKHLKEIDITDFPISETYLDSLRQTGGSIITQSKWLSTAVVSSNDSLIIDSLRQLSMVDSVKWVWKGEIDNSTENTRKRTEELNTSLTVKDSILPSYYGYAEKQIEMLNGIPLHDNGYKGENMCIAIIDAGFKEVDQIPFFRKTEIKGTRNFVNPGKSVYEEDSHGTKVLSCLAANIPGVMIGTAPNATYWLLKSEDERTEFPIEEDYWVAAIEFADSIGADIITSSLGYFHFDVPDMNYSTDFLDGKSSFVSRAASIGIDKGLLIVCSAGNEGDSSWGKITFPSDVDNILTIGAITEEKEKSDFSSTGLTADYRIKPDLVALGSNCCVINEEGEVCYSNGTSFATPTVAGLVACLWQALHFLSNTEIVELLRQNASQYNHPDAEKGYGIPDIYKAYKNAW